ncbi:MAG: shikimate kinase [Alphaproteobacteria bacterium]|nr:shikimate kinase [Alphaproteobacteria bacterium]
MNPASGTAVPLQRPIVLVGLMGAGKSSIGRRLAQRLGVAFVDADEEIEKAAGMTISEIFDHDGEAVFRDGERRVIARLLTGPVGVLATGGGAFMDPNTRTLIRDKAISIWLKAELEVLLKRVLRRSNRPLLRNGDPRDILRKLMNQRYPVYAEADITVETGEGPHEAVIDTIVAALERAGSRT